MYRIDLCDLSHTPDPNTNPWLLPAHLRQGEDNAERQAVYREALRIAMEDCLTKEQRDALHSRYWLQKSMAEIGADLGITPSAASKRIAAGLRVLRERIGLCVKVHDVVSRQCRNDSVR